MTNQDSIAYQQSPPATRADGSATPAATRDAIGEEFTVIARNLDHPRGFTWGQDGAFYVAISRERLTRPAEGEEAPPARPDAPPSVVRIENGEAVPVVHGLPSTQDPYCDVM